MNIKIAGQSSKSNYHNTGSCANAVIYNEHELRERPELCQEHGVKSEELSWFDMDGHSVTGAEVMDKINRLTAHLGKNDTKFYCTMICPSDDERLAMGATIKEQLRNGRLYVFDVMNAYAENFHREGIKDRHNLVAFAIPHIFKTNGKLQIHWHVIQARKDASNKYKLSPLTNHRNTTKGAVRGGFDRVAFDTECEKCFDVRFGYQRRVEESFEYLLAEKKGTPEEKVVQETRLAMQNFPALEESIKTAISRREERLAREASEHAAKQRHAQEKNSPMSKDVPRYKIVNKLAANVCVTKGPSGLYQLRDLKMEKSIARIGKPKAVFWSYTVLGNKGSNVYLRIKDYSTDNYRFIDQNGKDYSYKEIQLLGLKTGKGFGGGPKL